VKPGTDWSGRGFRVDAFAQLNRGVPQFGGGIHMFVPVHAAMRLGWDTDALLLRIRVEDDTPVEAETDEDIYRRKGDAVFLDIAPKPGVDAYRRVAIAPGMTKEQPDVRVLRSRSLIQSESPFQAPYDRVEAGDDAFAQVSRMKTETGYTLDIRLPWRKLDVKPQVGAEIGLQVFVLSRETLGKSPFRCARWHPRSRPFQDEFGTERIRLAEEADPPVRAVIEDGPRGLDIAVTAAGAFAGKRVTVTSGDAVLAESVLMKHERSGYAVGSIPMPLSVSEAVTDARVMLDATCIGRLR
jgi:hypothetical protein